MSHQRGRARVACKLCNLRRVKCDRTQDGPCSNCRLADTPCQLINSRRGKYPRASNRRVEGSSSSHAPGTRQSPETFELTTSTDAPNNRQVESTESPASDRRGTRRYVSPSLSELAVQQDGASPSGKVVYMGDSANFKYVLHEVGDPFQTTRRYRFWGDNLQRSMLEKLGSSTQSEIRNMREEDDKQLRNNGVFQLPSSQVSDELVHSFWKYSYPVFPLFNYADFFSGYSSGTVSSLLLNAIYMVGTFHCPESVLQDAGFSCRYMAGLTFYRRAKALYDSDHESDGMMTIQATILMSNWWGGPIEQKDTWYWLGVAVSLAQSLGMHRSKSYHILPASTTKMWRRTWWVLYINDIHHAAVFGRPPHIHPRFCNIAALHADDFDVCTRTNSTSSEYGVSAESRLFLIHLTDLISRVGDCLVTKLSSTQANGPGEQASYNRLLQWEENLLRTFYPIPSPISPEQGFWPAMIHLLYWDYQIVFYRMLSEDPITVGLESPVFQAAGKITRLLEDLLVSGTLYHAPFIILPAIFASALVSIMNMREGGPDIRVVSEHRARLAMQILHKFQDTWPIAIWTRHLLDGLLKMPSARTEVHSETRETGVPLLSPTSDTNNLTREVYSQDASRASPGIAGMDSTPGLSPPHGTNNLNLFSYECLTDSQLSGFPLLFPFTNLFEDVGFNPEVYSGSMM